MYTSITQWRSMLPVEGGIPTTQEMFASMPSKRTAANKRTRKKRAQRQRKMERERSMVGKATLGDVWAHDK